MLSSHTDPLPDLILCMQLYRLCLSEDLAERLQWLTFDGPAKIAEDELSLR